MVSFLGSCQFTQHALHCPTPEHHVCYEGALQRMGEGSSFCLEERWRSSLHLISYFCQLQFEFKLTIPLHSLPSLHRCSFILLSKLEESAKYFRRQHSPSRKYISSSFLLLKFLLVFELPVAYCTYPRTSHQPHRWDYLEHWISPLHLLEFLECLRAYSDAAPSHSPRHILS